MTALLVHDASAATVDVAGVKREGTVNWWGSPAVLNSADVCYEAVLQIDVAALYLEKKNDQYISRSPQPGGEGVRIVLTMLRNIDANAFLG